MTSPRDYCEKRKILFTLVCVAIYLLAVFIIKDPILNTFSEFGRLILEIIFFFGLVCVALFIKWFARIKYGD